MACAAVAAWAALALAPGLARGEAPPPPAPQVVIGGHLYPKPFGLTYVYGRLRVPAGTPASAISGQRVTLYVSAFPFTGWSPVATLTSDFAGYFSYHTKIGQNTGFRAIWEGSTPVQSNDRIVKLPLRVRMRAPRPHSRLATFRGRVAPAHPGAAVFLQQVDTRGHLRSVARTVVAANSTFSVRFRLRRGGVFRALFLGDGQFGPGASREVRVKAPKKRHRPG